MEMTIRVYSTAGAGRNPESAQDAAWLAVGLADVYQQPVSPVVPRGWVVAAAPPPATRPDSHDGPLLTLHARIVPAGGAGAAGIGWVTLPDTDDDLPAQTLITSHAVESSGMQMSADALDAALTRQIQRTLEDMALARGADVRLCHFAALTSTTTTTSDAQYGCALVVAVYPAVPWAARVEEA